MGIPCSELAPGLLDNVVYTYWDTVVNCDSGQASGVPESSFFEEVISGEFRILFTIQLNSVCCDGHQVLFKRFLKRILSGITCQEVKEEKTKT